MRAAPAYAEYPVEGPEGYDAVTALGELRQDTERPEVRRTRLCNEVDA